MNLRRLLKKNICYLHVADYAAGKFPWLFPLLDRLDIVLEKNPYVQRMAWIFTFVLEKIRDSVNRIALSPVKDKTLTAQITIVSQ